MEKFFKIILVFLLLFSFCQTTYASDSNKDSKDVDKIKTKEKKKQGKKQKEKIIEEIIFSKAPGLKIIWERLKYYRELRGDFINGIQSFEDFLKEDKSPPKIKKFNWVVGLQGSLTCPGLGMEIHHDFAKNHYIELGVGADYDFKGGDFNLEGTALYKIVW